MPYKNVTPEKFEELIKSGEYELIDVRTPEEYVEGKIEGHKLINFRAPDFQEQLDQLDKSKNYLVYCRSGNRSGQTCQLMEQKGFSGELVNLDGGIQAWNEKHN